MKLLFSLFDLRVCKCFSDAVGAQAEEYLSFKDGVVGGLKDPSSLSNNVDEERVHIFGFKLSELRSGERRDPVLHRKRVPDPTHKAEGLGLNHDVTLLAKRDGLTGDLTVVFDLFGTVHSVKPPIFKVLKP